MCDLVPEGDDKPVDGIVDGMIRFVSSYGVKIYIYVTFRDSK